MASSLLVCRTRCLNYDSVFSLRLSTSYLQIFKGGVTVCLTSRASVGSFLSHRRRSGGTTGCALSPGSDGTCLAGKRVQTTRRLGGR